MLFPFVCLHLFFKKRDRSTTFSVRGTESGPGHEGGQASTVINLGSVLSPSWRSNPHPFCQWDFQGPPIMGPPYGKLPIL